MGDQNIEIASRKARSRYGATNAVAFASRRIVRSVFIACTRLSSRMSVVFDSAISKSLEKAGSKETGLVGMMAERQPRMQKGTPALRRVIEIFFETIDSR